MTNMRTAFRGSSKLMTNEEYLNRLSERVGHPDTMRHLTTEEIQWYTKATDWLQRHASDTEAICEWLKREVQ